MSLQRIAELRSLAIARTNAFCEACLASSSCLPRRTGEPNEPPPLAVLGAEHTQVRHGADATLSLIADLLREAEYAVRHARRLAQGLHRRRLRHAEHFGM
jgi:hypothetical protein